MYAMPTRKTLENAQGERFLLWVGADQAIEVELLDVQENKAMTPRHECFSVLFALPQSLFLPQAVYRLAPSGDEGWQLLMTPNRPAADGRHTLAAVFHWERPTTQAV
ncbi:hypothetical protein EQ836_12465 [Ectopseudomonas mendocina]|uniref:DUF6916 domain-containing protein n=1 Tax=Ectopseudomonas mendocina TaxID=300 RepID=A0ABD7RXD4_ECTME|nr:hypothetical protein [Pseudomonas mendocina]TRO14972.1 hypothetical protein EQ829_06485 [Pseudomonas mendocina]TRO18367.1 hypothetical protein EQ836_12465 [Pseudomonas mendocina]